MPRKPLNSPARKSFKWLILLLFVPLAAPAEEISPEELERWFESDEFAPPRALPGSGELSFIEPRPQAGLHHHSNILTIVPASLRDGWVRMEQCHANMDAVGRVEIVFRAGRVRELEVTRSEKIGRAWVEGPSVQLEDVAEGARVCVRAWTRALRINDDGSFTLYNGPYMRRFLDGYFPMHVSAEISFAGTGLKFVAITPPPQPGFEVVRKDEALSYDAWFEGRLVTEIHFSPDIL